MSDEVESVREYVLVVSEPRTWECDLFCSSLLKEEPVLCIEEEDGEGAVEQSFVDVGHQMACIVS